MNNQEQFTEDDNIFFKRFKEIKSDSFRKHLIKQYARLVHFEKMDIILSSKEGSNESNHNLLSDYYIPSEKISNNQLLITNKSAIITNTWSVEKLLNEVEYSKIEQNGFDKHTDVGGEYIVDYDLLLIHNENHRVNRGILLDDVVLDLQTNRIDFYDIEKGFIDVEIFKKSYKDPKDNKIIAFNTQNEYKLYNMIRLDLEKRLKETYGTF